MVDVAKLRSLFQRLDEHLGQLRKLAPIHWKNSPAISQKLTARNTFCRLPSNPAFPPATMLLLRNICARRRITPIFLKFCLKIQSSRKNFFKS